MKPRPSYTTATEKNKKNAALEEREKGFNIYLEGANKERVDSHLKRTNLTHSKSRSKSRDNRKGWGVSQTNEPVTDSSEGNEDTKPAERRKWNVAQPNKLPPRIEKQGIEDESQKIHDEIDDDVPSEDEYLKEQEELESKNNPHNNEKEDDNDERIQKFLGTMSQEDMDILRKSLVQPLKKAELQEAGIYDDDGEGESGDEVRIGDTKKNKDMEDEIPENFEYNSPTEIENQYYQSAKNLPIGGDKQRKVIKARPISATYGANSYLEAFTNSPIEKPKQQPIIENKEGFRTQYDNANTKKLVSNPFKKRETEEGLSRSKTSAVTIAADQQNDYSKKEQPKMVSNESKPKESASKNPQSKKDLGMLLKRIMMLDDDKKTQIEIILEQIEKGTLDNQALLGLNFLAIKKQPQQELPNNEIKPVTKTTSSQLKDESSIQSKPAVNLQKPSYSSKNQTSQKVLTPSEESTRKIELVAKDTYEKPKPIVSPNEPLKINFEGSGRPTPLQTQKNDSEKSTRQDSLDKHSDLTSDKDISTTPKYQSNDSTPKFTEDFILLRIISTWGTANLAGLTELEVFDKEGRKYKLNPASFTIRNGGLSSGKTIEHLINGRMYTVNEEDMWVCSMPPPPKCAEIGITLEGNRGVGALRIWNYNKSLIESTKGIKEFELILNQQLIWSGTLQRGPGNEKEEYVTEIKIIPDIKLPKLDSPVQPIIERTEIHEGSTVDDLALEELKHEALAKDRPITVPIWLQEGATTKTNPKANIYGEINTVRKLDNLGTNRDEHFRINLVGNEMTPQRSDPLFQLEKRLNPEQVRASTEIGSKRSDKLRLAEDPERNDLNISESHGKRRNIEQILELDTKPKSTKLKHHPRINSPFSEFLDNPHAHADVTAKHKEEPDNSQAKPRRKILFDEEKVDAKKEEKIDSIEYFNLTNLGRLKPAKRESLMQVLNLKNDVQEVVKNINRNLEFTKKDPDSHSSGQNPSFDILSEFKRSDKPLVDKKDDTSKYNKLTGAKPVEKDDTLDKILKKDKSDRGNKFKIEENTNQRSRRNSIDEESLSKMLYDNQQFIIPELPKGKMLKLVIYTTWGDAYYVGLCGIEMFDENGKAIKIHNPKKQLRAEPPDINILPGYGKDPRTVDKLVDGTYLTKDDLHLWLAPYTKGKQNYVTIDFERPQTISMLRIWNYNKSRTHSFRGARDVVIKLDDRKIFQGEISMAPGSMKDAQDFCEYIMFTENESIIAAIEKEDWLNKHTRRDSLEMGTSQFERPLTGTRKFDEEDLRGLKGLDNHGNALLGPDGRPLTSAKIENETSSIKAEIEKNKKILEQLDKQAKLSSQQSKSVSSSSTTTYGGQLKCKRLLINLLNSWGDNFYIGLTGIEIYDGEGKPIPLKIENLNAKPRDMNCIPGYSDDRRVLDNLINGVNQTCEDQNMWLIPFVRGQSHLIYINFLVERTVSALKIWNYNKNGEDTYRGVKILTITADGVPVTPTEGILIRKAPGSDIINFGQLISLPFLSGWNENKVALYKTMPARRNKFVTQEYDTPSLPAGFCVKITILSTWGDFHYVGLNGLELYDEQGEPIISRGNLKFDYTAEPPSINALNPDIKDIRTPDKLFNGVNNTFDDRNMWLAPYVAPHLQDGRKWRTEYTTIWIVFDSPILLSAINFWNYAKTPERGIREFEIAIDDNVIYRGYLRIAPPEPEFKAGKDLNTTIVFTHNDTLLAGIDPRFYTEEGSSQEVLLYNEKRLVNPQREQKKIRESVASSLTLERPTTSVIGLKK